MRATLYEALEVPATAETATIRSALRAVLRRFWSVPRDPSGDTEEAVRFVALGAGILTHLERREDYDAQARRGVSTNPWRMGKDGTAGADSNLLGGQSGDAGSAQLATATTDAQRAIPAVRALTEPLPELQQWSSGFAYALSSVVLCAAALFVYFAAYPLLGSHASMLFMLLVLAGGFTIATQTKVVTSELSGFTLARLAITKWRRETSVFVGNPPPQQDTAWIFRLRVMELTRSAAGYSSAPHISIRLLARCADYALIALVVMLVLLVVGWVAPSLSPIIALLRSPILLPAVVVLLAVPIEAYAIAKWRATPGKFLLGVVVACALTQPDDQPEPSAGRLSTARALAFARGAAYFGFWPLVLSRCRRQLRALRGEEGAWEAAGDSVTLVRAAPLLMRASAASLVLAASVGLLSLWYSDAVRLLPSMTKTANEVAIAPLKDAAKQVTEAAKSTLTPSDVPTATPAPTPSPTPNPTTPAPETPVAGSVATPAATPPAAIPPATQSKATEAAVAPKTLPPSAPAKPAASEKAVGQSEFDKQTAVAQQRRARIEAAEKRVAAARVSRNYAGLQATCERWTIDQPGSAEAWRCLGLAQFQAGAGRGALPALRQALKIEPNDAEIEAAIFSILRP